MKKIIKILLTIQLLTSGVYCYCQSNVTPTGTTSYFAIGGYNAFDHSTPATPVILDGQDLGCYEEDGHPGGLHQDAMTNNTSVSLYVYNGGTSDLHLPSDVYIKIIYNINEPSIPYRYSFNTAVGYVYGTAIPFTLTDKGEYNFIYEFWRRGVDGSPDEQLFPSLCPRPIYVWYDTPINPDDITFEANATSVCTGSTVCFSTNYQPAVYYYSKCGSSGHHWFQNSPILVDFDDPWDLINFPPPRGDAGVMTYPFLSLVLDQTNLSSGSVPQHLEIPYDPTSPLLCHTYTDPGVYTARLYLDNYISQVIIPLTITVGDHFDVTITYDNNCNDEASVLTAKPSDFPPYTYSWSTTETTNPITVPGDGTYTVTVTRSSTCSGTGTINFHQVECCRESSGLLSFDGSPSIPFNLNTIAATLNSTTSEIALNGELNITSTLSINDCPYISMGENALLRVPRGKTMTILNSHLKACDKMWKGIYVDDGGTLIIDNSIIEDAFEGIHVEGKGHIEITNSTFDRDYIGINISNCSVSKSDLIEGNVFKCTGGNTLSEPYTGKRTFAGIKIFKVKGITLGDELYTASSANQFLSINNGVITHASETYIYNNVFDNIKDYTTTLPPFHQGIAIFSSGKTILSPDQPSYLEVSTNLDESSTVFKFTNCYKGIYFEGTTADIYNNTMDNVNYGVISQNNKAKDIWIAHNKISHTTGGITCSLNPGSLTVISKNIIDITDPATASAFPASYSNSYGISISEVSPKIFSYNFISDNDITSGRNGIKLLNTGKAVQLYNNHIYFTSASAMTGKQNAILVTNSDGSMIRANIIDGNGTTYIEGGIPIVSPFRKKGIAVDRSRNLNISCNEVNNIGYSLHFQGNCETSFKNITENTVTDCKYGWVFQKLFSYGYIGKNVGFNGTSTALLNNNNFFGTFDNPSNYRTYNFTSTSGAPYCPNIWHNTDPEPLYNGNNLALSPLSVRPEHISSGLTITTSNNCTSGPGAWGEGFGIPDNNGEEKDMELINEEIYTEYDEVVTKWLEEEDLYEKLGKDSTLIIRAVEYELFYNSKKEGFIGEEYDFEKNYQNLSDTTILQDSLLLQSAIENSIADNDNINSIIPFQINLKRVQSIYLWLFNHDIDSLSQSDKSFLETMYYSCPYIEGRAIYLARAIYPLLNNGDMVDDLELCNSQGIYKMGNPNALTINMTLEPLQNKNLIFLKQNPANESIQLIYNLNPHLKCEIEILNMNGLSFGNYSLNVDEHSLTLDSKNLVSGLYLLSLRTSDGTTKKIKVNIIH